MKLEVRLSVLGLKLMFAVSVSLPAPPGSSSLFFLSHSLDLVPTICVISFSACVSSVADGWDLPPNSLHQVQGDVTPASCAIMPSYYLSECGIGFIMMNGTTHFLIK